MVPDSPQSFRRRWLLLLLLATLVCLGHFNRVSISVAGNERFIRDGLIDEVSMGQIYTVFLLVYTACMLPAGWFIDRFGPTTALACMALGMGLCVALTGIVGLGPSAAGLWLSLAFVRGAAGAASSPLHPAAARCVSLWFPSGMRSRTNGIVTAGALLGIAGSYPVFGALLDRFTWQYAFVICGAAMVAFACVWRFVAANGESGGRTPSALREESDPQAIAVAPLRPPTAARGACALIRDRSLVLISLSYAAVGYFQYLFFYWIEHYFSHTLQLSDEYSRAASSIVMLAMAGGMVCGGWLADSLCRRSGEASGRRAVAVGGMSASAAFAILGIATTDPDRVVLWFSLALASLGACEGVFWTTVTDLGGQHAGVAAAFLNTFGNAGGALAPWLTAVLMTRFDWSVALGVACAISVTGGALWLGIDPLPPNER